ncbi:MAG: response regulator [Candidatus Omnitrophica bacterium]|nr:response regulator [Candidatus Omnitrophota bacterium]
MERKKILVIDDDTKVIEKLRMQLVIHDFEVFCASNGLEGIEKVRAIKPDLILLDLLMPKMDGLKAARLIKFDERFKDIPIFAITHLSRLNSEQQAYEVGIDEFFTKPIDIEKVTATIEKYLKKA